MILADATSELTFMPSTWSVGLSMALVIATAVICFVAWRRSGFAPGVGALELLRLAIVVFIAVLLNQPEWQTEYRPETKPTVAVLWDNSPSMETVDAENTVGGMKKRRAEVIETLTKPEAWKELGDDLRVLIESTNPENSSTLSGSSDGGNDVNVNEVKNSVGDDEATISQSTNLNEPLSRVADEVTDLMGVVVISDGDWNDGPPPVDAATRLRMRGVPIFTVTVGSSRKLPDIELLTLDLPTFATLGKPVRIPFTLQSSLPRDVSTTVTLTASDGEKLVQQVEIAAMAKTSDAFIWKPDARGDYDITVDVALHPEDVIPTNNSRSAPIAMREEKLRVLVVESLPRWEYRYLRNALSRDPGVDVSCLLFHPSMKALGGGSTDYIKAFPETIEDLSPYDVVFIGDVGIDDGQLTTGQANLLKGLVQFQASGLVFMPGFLGRQFSLLETELDELYPVELDPMQPDGWGAVQAGHFQLSETGRTSLLTKLADTTDENVQVWEDLPGFQWFAPVLRARPGTETLAVHGEVTNRYGRLPLLVTRTFGTGKVLFMGTDGAWRWRKGVEDKYHYRFWGQVVRWMAYQRNMARGESMRFYYTPDQPGRKQTMTLTAHVVSKSGEPLQQGNVLAQIIAPSGRTKTERLLSEGESWGVFRGRFTPDEPGRHEVIVTSPQAAENLTTSFFVQGQLAEPIGKPARPEVLEELALVSGGLAVRPDQIEQIVANLASLPMPPPAIRRLQLWCHPLAALALILMLGIFWAARKQKGLI